MKAKPHLASETIDVQPAEIDWPRNGEDTCFYLYLLLRSFLSPTSDALQGRFSDPSLEVCTQLWRL